MKQQLYDDIVSEYSVGVTSENFIPSKDAEGIVEMLNGKIDQQLSAQDIEIDNQEDGSYNVSVNGYDGENLANNGVLNYSPDNQRCVTHSNKPIGNEPPEGRTLDGNGQQLKGMR